MTSHLAFILRIACYLFFFLLLMTWMMLSRWVSGFQVSPVAGFSPNVPVAKHFHRSSSVKVRVRNRGSVKMGTQKGTISENLPYEFHTWQATVLHVEIIYIYILSALVCKSQLQRAAGHQC